MVVTPTTDLAPYRGARVVISGFRYARIHDIQHGADARHTGDALAGGVWGLMFEEPRGDSRGGNTAFHFDYGTTIELAEEN